MSIQRNSGRGFTLVELLVVIGIIALLISILLPSLARARESANTVKCLSNMRQIGMGMMQYVMDNKGIMPPMQVAASTAYPSGTHWGLLLGLNGYVPTSNMLSNPSDRWSHDRATGNAWMCPSMVNNVHISGNATTHWDGQVNISTYNFSITHPSDSTKFFGIATSYGLVTVGTQYAMYDTFPFVNYWHGGTGGGTIDGALNNVQWKRNVSKIKKTTITPMIVEGQSMNYWQKPAGVSPYPELFAARHGQPTNKGWDGKTNVVFFDGHGETIDTNLVNLEKPTWGQHDFSAISSSLCLLMRDQTK